MRKGLSQKERVLRLLLAGRVLNPIDVKFASRLTSRIDELVNDGWLIERGWQRYKDTRIRTYRLPKAHSALYRCLQNNGECKEVLR